MVTTIFILTLLLNSIQSLPGGRAINEARANLNRSRCCDSKRCGISGYMASGKVHAAINFR